MPGAGTLKSLAELLALIVLFLIVLVVCYYTTKFVAGRQIKQKKKGNFETIETYAIAQNKYLQLVRMGDKYVVIAVSKDSVRYVTELAEEEICRFERAEGISTKSFRDILASLHKERQTDGTDKKENSIETRKG